MEVNMVENKKEYGKLQSLMEKYHDYYNLEIDMSRDELDLLYENIEDLIDICQIKSKEGELFYFRHSPSDINEVMLTAEDFDSTIFSMSIEEVKKIYKSFGKLLKMLEVNNG